MVIAANRIFRRIGTNTRPSQPTLALATTGLFTWTRNPMYVGGSLALFGIAIGFALDWVILLLVASLPLVHYGIILREERYLKHKFGDEYRRYQTKVPRYWWRF
jgi:protein-S-isoprenylcysteine O-methyltransferase Ste14